MQIRKNRSRWRKRTHVILTLVLILFVFSILGWVTRPLETETLKVSFTVGRSIGFNVDTDELNFGKVTPGGSATRNIIIENEYENPVKVRIFISKNIANFVFARNNYVVSPKATTKIPITLKVPGDMDFGNYTGKIRFESRKA